MNIIVATDSNLYKHIPTLYNSISVNNKKFNFFILSTDLEEKEKQYIREKTDGDPNVIFQDTNPDIVIQNIHCKIKSKAMFNRIFSINSLSKVINKGIYLDIDTIVNHNLDDLYNSETGSCGLAGVNDIYSNSLRKQLNVMYTLNKHTLEKDTKAFNSGVLLMDFNKLAKNNAQEWMLDILYKDYMTDQPLLNWYSNGRYKSLDRKWNVSANHIDKFVSRGQLKMPDHYIFHWHGKKPWERRCPYQHIYDKYKKE